MSKTEVGPGRRRQTGIYVRGLGGEKPPVPVAPEGLQRAAQRKLRAEAFAYVAGGAGAERAMRANLAAFEQVRLLPWRLAANSNRNLSVELFGHRYASPLLLAPVGALELVHPQADLAVGRAAAAEGVPYVLSSQASVPLEQVTGAMGEAPRWF